MHTQTVEAAQWWTAPRQSGDWVANYMRSTQARHRTAIVEAMRPLAPASVLEVGCHCGPNLIRLAQEFPEIMASGVDTNQQAVQAGQQWAASLGVSDRVELTVGRVPEATAGLPDQCVDVVLSCYALAYIAPSDLDGVLWELGRLAKKALLLAEPQIPQGAAHEVRSLSGYTEWAHAYAAAASWIGSMRPATVSILPITPPVDRLNAICQITRSF